MEVPIVPATLHQTEITRRRACVLSLTMSGCLYVKWLSCSRPKLQVERHVQTPEKHRATGNPGRGRQSLGPASPHIAAPNPRAPPAGVLQLPALGALLSVVAAQASRAPAASLWLRPGPWVWL